MSRYAEVVTIEGEAGDVFKRNVRLFIIRSFILSIYQGIYDVIFNLYVLDMGFHADFLGLMLSVNLLASSLASIPAGILCDRFNKRKMMLVFGFLAFIAVIPLFISNSPAVLLLFSVVSGVCSSVGAVCATPLLMESCEKDTIRVFSLNSAFSLAASIIGCTLGGLLPGILPLLHITSFGGYRLTMLISLVLIFAGWAILLLFKSTGAATRNKGPMKVRLSSNLIKFTLISASIGIGTGMIVPYFNVYFTKVLHATSFETGLAFAVADALMVVGFAITPRISSWLGKVRATTITQLASLPFLLLMAVATSFTIGSFAYSARMVLMNLAGPALTSFQMELIHPDERSFAIGLMSMVSGLVVAASTYVGGFLMAGGNYVLPYVLTCGAYVVAAVAMYHWFKDVEKIRVERIKSPSNATAAGTKI